MESLLELVLGVLLEHRTDLLRPRDDGAFEERDLVLASTHCARSPNGIVQWRHGESRFSLDLTTKDGCRGEEVMEAVHQLSGGHFSPLGLVLRVGEHGQKDLIREKFKVLKGRGPSQLSSHYIRLYVRHSQRARVKLDEKKDFGVSFGGELGRDDLLELHSLWHD